MRPLCIEFRAALAIGAACVVLLVPSALAQVAVILLGGLAGCASLGAQDTENMLSAAQFSMKPATTPAQLAIAWCTKNPRVSTVITGASKVSQLQDNLGAMAVAPRMTAEVM